MMPRRVELFIAAVGALGCASPAFLSPAAGDEILAPGAAVKSEGIVAFLEGPAWHPTGNVFFSDVENNRILRRDPHGKIHQWRTPSGRANGLVFDPQGRLVACEGAGEGGNRRVTRTEANGTITVLAERFQGKRFNSPNDVTVDARGRVYFTDPRYGPRTDMELLDDRGTPIEGVYRIDAPGKVARLDVPGLQRPNGIATSPDGKALYVVDNHNGSQDGNRKVWRFDLDEHGATKPDSRRLMHDFGRGRGGDGLEIDVAGRLYVAAGLNIPNPPTETDAVKAGVYVISPEGKQVAFIPVLEDMVTNVCFGGDDHRTLYITAGHTLFSVRVATPGFMVWPRLAQ